jgi:putative solute:sodium symporter small subunit
MPKHRVASQSATSSYWRQNLRLTVVLMVLLAALTFIPAFFFRQLSFNFIGWPFAFWMAAYGAPLAYLILIVVYARLMNKADVVQEHD